jgi:transposase-like protein
MRRSKLGRKNGYSEAYKSEAVVKAKASGNVSQTARELGISNKSLHGWIKQYNEPFDAEAATERELVARVRELEQQLAVREAQIEVLVRSLPWGKKAIGIVSQGEESGS